MGSLTQFELLLPELRAYARSLGEEADAAERAITELTGHPVGLKRLKVSLAAAGKRSQSNCYVAGLGREMTRSGRFGEFADLLTGGSWR